MSDNPGCHIYLNEIPYSESGCFWVSFESDPQLKKTRDNIYGRCLPCMQSLYDQLQEGRKEIILGFAYTCWKITAVVRSMEECLHLLTEFEKRWSGGRVYGKLGSGRPHSETKVVVFQAESERERDRLRGVLEECLPIADRHGHVAISRACAVLYDEILGDWRDWRPVTPVKHHENASETLKRIRKTLFWSVMD